MPSAKRSSPVVPTRSLETDAVQLAQPLGYPVATQLRHDDLQAGEPLEDAPEQQVDQGALGEERRLGELHQATSSVEVAVVRRAGPTVKVHRYVEILECSPQRVVRPVEVRLQPGDVGREVREQHAASQTVLLDPAGVGDGVVEVVDEDLADPGPPFGAFGDEVNQPSVVGPDARQAVPVFVAVAGRRREEHEAGEEGGDRVREEDLRHDTVGLHVRPPALRVPVAHPLAGVPEVPEGVLVLAPPGVEIFQELAVEVLPVLGVAATGMAVGGDQGVVVGKAHRRDPSCWTVCRRSKATVCIFYRSNAPPAANVHPAGRATVPGIWQRSRTPNEAPR